MYAHSTTTLRAPRMFAFFNLSKNSEPGHSGANPSEIVRSCSKLRNITTVEYYASTRFGLGDQKNDEKLVYFCSFLLLVLSTALCEHIPCHKISWLGIRNIHISSRFRNCLLNTCNQRAMTRPQNVDRQFNAGSFLYC